MKKRQTILSLLFIVIYLFIPISLFLGSNIIQKNIINASNDCKILSAVWNPSGQQAKDFYKGEGRTISTIFIKSKNCFNKILNLSIVESDGLTDLTDDVLNDSGLYKRNFNVPENNFNIKIQLGEEDCEFSGTSRSLNQPDCELYFNLYNKDVNIYRSYSKDSGVLKYNCEGRNCLDNGKLLGIIKSSESKNYYYEKDKVNPPFVTKRIKLYFNTLNECSSSLVRVPSNLNPSLACLNNSIVVFSPNEKIEYDPNNYKLLAPLGKTTSIPTDDIGKYFNIIFDMAIGIAGVLAVIMLVVGGIQWMGSESVFGKTNGKEKITSAILGLLIAIGSYAILNTINPDLLGKNGLNVDQVSITLDPEVHGDTPQTSINGKYCNGKYTNNTAWVSDETERVEVEAVGITINKNNCTYVGESNCTSLTGLDVSKIISFKNSCGTSCDIKITGGTECWLHSNKTKHLPQNTIVDLHISTSIQNYIEKNAKIRKDTGTGFNVYDKNGFSFLKETNHYHVLSW